MQIDLHLKLFGCPQIIRAGSPVEGFISSKVPALFYYLAVTNRYKSRDVLGTLFWGDLPQNQARKNLRDALSNLRKLLEPYILVNGSEIAFNSQMSYRLDVEAFEIELPVALKTGDLAALNKIGETYQGDFLEGFFVKKAPAFEEWVQKKREYFHRLAGETFRNLVEINLAQGDILAALNANNKWLALEPWNEEAHRVKITLLLKNGQRSAALAQYATCQRALMEELGSEPDPLTQTLIKRLEAASRPVPHNIPPGPAHFVGREAELRRIHQLVTDKICHLITVLGPGGSGKTALALKAAAFYTTQPPPDLDKAHFPDGVYFVSLANLEGESRTGTVRSPVSLTVAIVHAIGEVIQYAFQKSEAPAGQLINYLAGKQMLLVLDNFEDLASYSGLLGQILQEAPGLKFLVTSRVSLNLMDEWLLELGGLSVPLPAEPLSIEQSSAYSLFMYHARRIVAGFRPSPAEQVQIIKLCQLVEGLPLAIELAVSWLRTLPLDEIVSGIEGSFDFLTIPFLNMPERHRSLRIVFEHSWRLLSPEEQTTFRKLAVCAGGVGRAAAQMIAGTENLVLSRLVNKSLLHFTPEGRYEVHAVVRQYAFEKLKTLPQQFQNTNDLHCTYFAHFLAQTAPRLKGAEQKKALDEIYRDLENIRKAWRWAVANGQEQQLELLLDGLFNFYSTRNYFEEGQASLNAALAALQLKHSASPRLTGRLLAWLGLFYLRLGFYDQGQAALERAIGLLRCANDTVEVAFALDGLGRLYMMGGKYNEALPVLQESLSLCQITGDQYGIATALYSCGRLAEMRGQYTEARRHMEQSLVIRRSIKDYRGLALSLNYLGSILATQRQYDQASRLYRESFELFEMLGDKWGVALSFTKLGDAAFEREDYPEAQIYFVQALRINANLGVLPKILSQLSRLATVYLLCGQDASTLEIFGALSDHPSLEMEARERLEQIHRGLLARLSQPEITALTTYNRGREVKEIIEQILAGSD